MQTQTVVEEKGRIKSSEHKAGFKQFRVSFKDLLGSQSSRAVYINAVEVVDDENSTMAR